MPSHSKGMEKPSNGVVAQPKTARLEKHGYEFGGPAGVAFITFGIHFVPYVFALLCNDISGCPVPSILYPSSFSLHQFKAEIGWQGLSSIINLDAFLATLGWYALSLFLYAVLPATEAQGVLLRNGARLKYRLNAFMSAIFTLVVLLAGTVAQGTSFPVWVFIWDNYTQILSSNIIIAHSLAVYVYVCSFSVKRNDANNRLLAAGGTTGNMLYDFWIGRELNPRIKFPLLPEVDIKAFMELRPGMTGWILLDLAFMAQQYRAHGFITDSMLLCVGAQTVYTLDAFYMEPAILTTIDIINDGFGLMLSFGDVAWLPFTYSIQCRYLATHPVRLGPAATLAVLALQLAGYYVFRAANNEKNRFRTDPNDPKVRHLRSLRTRSGSRLLVSGWWGRARHINYLGDWMMSWAYCLPTGVAGYLILPSSNPSVPAGVVDGWLGPKLVQGEARGWGMLVTYFYMLYFAVLLVHRERRDEEKCRKKYGEDWDEYCRIVPWRIIPYVY